MPLTKAEISRLRSLHEKKHRETLGLFVVEGEKVIRELLAEGGIIDEIYVTEASVVSKEGVEQRLISAAEMSRISHFPTPSRALAVGKLVRRTLAHDLLNQGLTLVLDALQDAGNVGTLLRIADWFGVARVVMSADCADLYSQKVINASMGSFHRVPTYVADLKDALANVKLQVPILGCDLHGEPLGTIGGLADAVIVMGSEGRGLSDAVARHVTRRVTIPRYGAAESLNVAVAAGIVCAHLRSAV
ncbi:MAG TPA: RNA methyltransferase [Opitutaceae bacterium]|nr:RNA methyltransferase [Opitutaceae bacterium]